eukprot:9267024-Pyramimonas_sp.AAC.1
MVELMVQMISRITDSKVRCNRGLQLPRTCFVICRNFNITVPPPNDSLNFARHVRQVVTTLTAAIAEEDPGLARSLERRLTLPPSA